MNSRKCNENSSNFRSFARLGEHDLSITTDGDTQDIKIIRSEKHPAYNKRDGTSDISVLYLEYDAVLSRMCIIIIPIHRCHSLFTKLFILYIARVTPICMPFEDEIRSSDFTGYRPFVAGWGYLKEGGKSSNVLQELQLPILDNEICKGRYLKQNKLFSEDQFDGRVICAGNLSVT